MVYKKLFPFLLLMLPALATLAQDTTKQTDLMRSNGRIYVVVAVMVTILIGLVMYLVRLDKKISKLEKENN